MLYQHKITGGLVEKISQHGDGIFMVVNANDEVDYVHENDLIPHLDATNEKIKTEERLTAELKALEINLQNQLIEKLFLLIEG